MPIITSTYTQDAHAQQDGSVYTTERHIDSEGQDYQYLYACPVGMNPDTVMAARRAQLDAKLAERDEALALVQGTALPLTKLKFRELFTPGERTAIDAFNAGFESHPALTAGQKADIRTGLEDFRAAQNIARPFLPPVLAMLGLYVSLGLLTTERRDEIVAAGAV